jgi:lipoprotein-releasing system ATP-binding protein
MGEQSKFAVELRNVVKIYGTTVKTEVLHNISLAFELQSFNSIIGQSGSGKSTLLNIMSTLDKPTSGEIYINGIRTDQMSNKTLATLRNQAIGFIFQFHYLLPEFTALENILMPYSIQNKKITPKVLERAEELIDLMGLTKVKNNNAQAMSGGQQQRTAIARALINDPKIIFADEPTGNLDSDTTEVVYNLMRKINKKYGTTFIIVTHDQKIAEKTERIVEIRDGSIILDVKTR